MLVWDDCYRAEFTRALVVPGLKNPFYTRPCGDALRSYGHRAGSASTPSHVRHKQYPLTPGLTPVADGTRLQSEKHSATRRATLAP